RGKRPLPARSTSLPSISPPERAMDRRRRDGAGFAVHLGLIADEIAFLARRPLSARQGRLVAALLDVASDRAYAALREGPGEIGEATDRADYRDRALARSPALALIGRMQAGMATLRVEAVPVPEDAVADLDVGDLMVSVYNDQTVPRLMI